MDDGIEILVILHTSLLNLTLVCTVRHLLGMKPKESGTSRIASLLLFGHVTRQRLLAGINAACSLRNN